MAVVFTPYLGVKLLPNITVHHTHDPHAIYETRIYRGLRAVVQWCVNHRIKVVVATVGVFVASIVGFGNVQQQFFPLSERPELFFQLRLPEGTAFNVTEKAVKEAEKLLQAKRTFRPTRPMSARARRASGSGSTRNCRTRPLPRS